MWRYRQWFAVLLLMGAVPGISILPSWVGAQNTPVSAVEFHDAMRKLWEDHITWTRVYIISVAGDLPDKDFAAQRLLTNQTDIGNAIKPFYGEDAGNQLTSLLEVHILGAVAVLDAAKAGDTAVLDTAKADWYANGDDIAAFLNSANPDNWPLEAVQNEMKMHLDLTLNEAVARLEGDFEADIAAYDEVHEHILALADTLSNGIMHQFPEMFAPVTLPVAAHEM